MSKTDDEFIYKVPKEEWTEPEPIDFNTDGELDKIVQYGAVGEEGCEFMASTEREVDMWIAEEEAGTGQSTEPMPEDYYVIHAYTAKELKEMREV